VKPRLDCALGCPQYEREFRHAEALDVVEDEQCPLLRLEPVEQFEERRA
jgi:hypothetical protein